MRRIIFMCASAVIIMTALGTSMPASTYASSAHRSSQRVTKNVKATTVNGTFAFSPAKLTIHIGTRVVWTNTSVAPHTVTGKGHWSVNKQLSQGASVSVVFTKPGTYKYYCAIHPYMLGTIIVRP